MAENSKTNDYNVGYGKPPKHAQFQTGQSGNPKGRPKGSKNLKTDLEEVLRETIRVREGERAKTVSKQRAFVIGLVNRSLKGDAKAANQLQAMMFRLLDHGDAANDQMDPVTDDEQEILDTFAARVRQDAPAPDEAADLEEAA